ncbi:hypothetical protein B7463_g3788, partial [Scytalidium lignicola]
MLYSAQQHQNNQAPSPMTQGSEITDPIPPIPTNHAQRQSSLHAFWNMSGSRHSSIEPSSAAAAPSISSSPTPMSHFSQVNCEDCNACLAASSAGDDSMDVDMDVDVYGMGADFGCSACGKQVCHQCAVSNLGAERMCLVCAGRKKWVGGLGWVPVN